jgi:guanylate kinase
MSQQADSSAVPRRGRPFIVAAPSGTGKTTVCRHALERDPLLRFSVSHTTREPREGERDGIDYHFVKTDEFRNLVDRQVFLEFAEFNANLYGTSIEALEGPLSEGLDPLVEIEVQGARQLRDRLPDACFVFLLPPDMATLATRLHGRGTDTPETINRRLAIAEHEIEAIEHFDYVIVNHDLDRAVDAFIEIIGAVRGGEQAQLATLYGRKAAFSRWQERARLADG